MIAETTAGIAELRKRAAEYFATRGYPTTREEDWRFTNVAPIVKAAFANSTPNLVGGTPAEYSLQAALERSPELVEEHLGRYAAFEGNPFVALNTAHFEDGAFVNIPANTVVEEPIRIELKAPAERATHPRNLIVVGAGSQVQIVEKYTGTGRYFTNAVTEIVVGENAVVEHIKLEEESPEAFHVATIQVQQARNSNFKTHSISLGGLLVRNDVNAVLATGSEGTVNGLYLISGKQHVDNHTTLDHAEPHAASH
jgi:Fe-S cluster assembly protein SufD